MANHTYNEQQIEWFKEGSALNLIKAKRSLILTNKSKRKARETWLFYALILVVIW